MPGAGKITGMKHAVYNIAGESEAQDENGGGAALAEIKPGDLPQGGKANDAWLRSLAALNNEQRNRISGWLYGD